MKNLKSMTPVIVIGLLLMFSNGCTMKNDKGIVNQGDDKGIIYIGWASADITPEKPVIIHGQFHARISEGVMDPVTVTALAIESGTDQSSEKAIMISCDLAVIGDDLRDTVREILKKSCQKLNRIMLFLTQLTLILLLNTPQNGSF